MGGQEIKRNLNFAARPADRKKSVVEASHEKIGIGAKNSGYTTTTGYPNLMEKSSSTQFLKDQQHSSFNVPVPCK